jgi:imidazoleglycerol-phosphate dehydratase
MRKGQYARTTKETAIDVQVNLDGEGRITLNSGVAFFDHLITTLAVHSQIDISVIAEGDLKHHVLEDIAICLGRALRQAIDQNSRINRFGDAIVPMDDALAFAALDLVNRPYAVINLNLAGEIIEDAESEDIIHFLETLILSLGSTVHLWVHYGTNDHHKIEAGFKALALALKHAMTITSVSNVPSAKGTM